MPLLPHRRWSVEVREDSHNPPLSFGLVAELEYGIQDGVRVLSSAVWDALRTTDAAWEAADAATELVNQSLALSSYGLATVSLSSRLWESRAGQTLEHARAIVGSAELFLDPIAAGNSAKRPIGDRIATLASRDNHFASAIAVFAKAGLDLPAIWVVFEHVEKHAGSEDNLRKLGWITRKSHRPFAETVDRVRHYRPKLPPPVQRLSPRQCRAYVRDLLERWLDAEEPI